MCADRASAIDALDKDMDMPTVQFPLVPRLRDGNQWGVHGRLNVLESMLVFCTVELATFCWKVLFLYSKELMKPTKLDITPLCRKCSSVALESAVLPKTGSHSVH